MRFYKQQHPFYRGVDLRANGGSADPARREELAAEGGSWGANPPVEERSNEGRIGRLVRRGACSRRTSSLY